MCAPPPQDFTWTGTLLPFVIESISTIFVSNVVRPKKNCKQILTYNDNLGIENLGNVLELYFNIGKDLEFQFRSLIGKMFETYCKHFAESSHDYRLQGTAGR